MIALIESLLLVTGVIVCSSPVCWLILQAGKVSARDNKKKNKEQAKRNVRV